MTFRRVHVAVVLTMLVAPVAFATPANKAAMERHFGGMLSKNLNRCTTCHLASDEKAPETLEEFPHNGFGDRLRVVGEKLGAEGKDRSIPARIALIAEEDADGDGVGNLAEILLGKLPGDKSDSPLSAELAELPGKVGAYEKMLASYRWRPFEVVKRPLVPTVKNAQWVRNPVDAFIAAEHEARGLSARGEASKGTLLRRAYIDLIGLNPTPKEIAAFEADPSEDGYEKVVERLLADPRYGERWGRHWMDVWRYSDWAGWTDGNQVRDSQPHIWRWRDWIVESLNADKGYDRMVIEMLAGDEVAPEDPAVLRATGFLARNYKMLSREQWLEDTVNHTSRALLGVTMHCAKCHDHLFDPVSQVEYYQFRALFEPHNVRVDHVPGVTDVKKDGLPRVFDAKVDAETAFFIRGDERKPDKDRAIAPGIPKLLGVPLEIKAVAVPKSAVSPERREFVVKDLIAESEKAMAAAQGARMKVNAEALAKGKGGEATPAEKKVEILSAAALAEAKHAALLAVLKVEEVEEKSGKGSEEWTAAALAATAAQRQVAMVEATQNLILAQRALVVAKENQQAGAKKKVADAEAAVAKAATELTAGPSVAYAGRKVSAYPETSTGRRLALAKAITDAKNPLSARVAANHIWLRHFGQGIVPTPADFGANGRAPTHPALLDWLAAELMEHSWSMKHLHRLIVTSATYRQSSAAGDAEVANSVDPDNLYLWRAPSRRLEAEAVRDNVLYAAGQLDPAMGGPEIDQKLGLTSNRRSLYFRIAPEKEVEFLKIFDGPATNECYQRTTSVVPQQALALGNSQLVLEKANVLGKTLGADCCEDDSAFVNDAFLRVLARRPSKEEAGECLAFLGGQKDKDRAYENLVVVLFNHNDFVTVR